MAPVPTLAAKCVAEFLGTFMLVFTVGCNVLGNSTVWGGVSIAFVLMVVIYGLGGISGGNFNPAVSLALGLSQAIDWGTVAIYMVTQIAAGVLAAFSYSFMHSNNSFTLGPAKGFEAGWQAGLCEVLYTFMLCFVVLNVAAFPNGGGSPSEFFALAIGCVIVAGAYGAGAVSGGCFNPAVALGIDVSSLFLGGGWSMIYVFCELLGACLAAGLFRVVRPERFGREKGLVAELVSELTGTLFLVLTVGLNVLAKSPAGGFSIAASLIAMIYALGDVSGGHFNPAVTVAIFAATRLKASLEAAEAMKMGMYIAVQLAGGILGGLIYTSIRNGESFPLRPGEDYFAWQVIPAEIIYTFTLCYTVLCVAVAAETKSSTMFGLAIGSCVTVGGNAIGVISGGSLNPAVSAGIAVSHFIGAGGAATLLPALCYCLLECSGALLAAATLLATHSGKAEAKEGPDLTDEEDGLDLHG